MKQVEASPAFDRVISWSLDNPFSAVTRYALATLLVVGAAMLRAALITDLLPWLLFIPITLIVGLLAGRGAGIYAVLLSAVLAAASIYEPGSALFLTGPQWGASALFIVVTIGIVLLAVELRAAFRRARLLVAEREAAHARLVEREEQFRLLNQELGHRLKNLLTVVQAVAGQTLRQSPDLKSANDALAFRLASLGQAADVLTASKWNATDIHAIATAALRTANGRACRIHLEGPSIDLKPQVAFALTLTLHELVTNAFKYGALSIDSGHVDLHWSVEPGAEASSQRFTLVWREIGGPAVQQPTRRGFGSLMIERLLASYFRGETSITYDPAGLVFRIDAPLAGARAESGEA